jgi:large subunit ribosomal protein L3
MLGLIGKNMGMTQIFNEQGALVPITVIHIEPNVVIGERTEKRDGYSALVLGAGNRKKNRIKKPYSGQFRDKIEPTAVLKEFREFGKEVKLGDRIGVELFDGIAWVDVSGISKGKGYQGVMKRHGFRGGRKSHGSKFHRAAGSTGMAASPSRVLPGTKMAGRMGGEKRTVQNLRLLKIDPEKGILLVKGCVPGRRGGQVLVTEAKKK